MTTIEQFFTPPELAIRMAEFALIDSGDRILEPSAGDGALVAAMNKVTLGCYKEIVAVEMYSEAFRILEGKCANLLNVRCVARDFLQCQPADEPFWPAFDVILQNPPFTGGSDVRHIFHALEFIKPGGRLVAICSAGINFRENLGYPKLRKLVQEGHHTNFMEDLPVGTFAQAGTQVKAVLLRITKE